MFAKTSSREMPNHCEPQQNPCHKPSDSEDLARINETLLKQPSEQIDLVKWFLESTNILRLRRKIAHYIQNIGLPTIYLDDVLQEIFEALVTNPQSRFDPSRGQPLDYLFGIGKNKAKNILSKHRRETSLDSDYLERVPRVAQNEVRGRQNNKDRLSDISEGLEHIMPNRKRVVLMRAKDEMEYEEIAEIMGTTECNVRALYSRGCDDIRKYVESKRSV